MHSGRSVAYVDGSKLSADILHPASKSGLLAGMIASFCSNESKHESAYQNSLRRRAIAGAAALVGAAASTIFNIFVWFTATQRIRRCNREQRRELLALPAIEAHE